MKRPIAIAFLGASSLAISACSYDEVVGKVLSLGASPSGNGAQISDGNLRSNARLAFDSVVERCKKSGYFEDTFQRDGQIIAVVVCFSHASEDKSDRSAITKGRASTFLSNVNMGSANIRATSKQEVSGIYGNGGRSVIGTQESRVSVNSNVDLSHRSDVVIVPEHSIVQTIDQVGSFISARYDVILGVYPIRYVTRGYRELQEKVSYYSATRLELLSTNQLWTARRELETDAFDDDSSLAAARKEAFLRVGRKIADRGDGKKILFISRAPLPTSQESLLRALAKKEMLSAEFAVAGSGNAISASETSFVMIKDKDGSLIKGRQPEFARVFTRDIHPFEIADSTDIRWGSGIYGNNVDIVVNVGSDYIRDTAATALFPLEILFRTPIWQINAPVEHFWEAVEPKHADKLGRSHWRARAKYNPGYFSPPERVGERRRMVRIVRTLPPYAEVEYLRDNGSVGRVIILESATKRPQRQPIEIRLHGSRYRYSPEKMWLYQ